MSRLITVLVAMVLSCAAAQARDEFTNVRCGEDITKALMGQRMRSERVVVIEARHQAIGLKHLGADIISDDMNTISWRICGTRIMVLEKRSSIRDMIVFPRDGTASPAFVGRCSRDGRKLEDEVIAVLDRASARGDAFPAKAAWRVDQKAARFVKVDANNLVCPPLGILADE